MGNYSAGSLDLSIIGYSEDAVSSITKTVRALNSLSNSIKKMQGVNYGAQANKLARFFDKMAQSTNAIDGNKLQMLASVASSFRGISSIAKLEKLDYSKVASGFDKLTIAITPFVNKVKEAEVGLAAMYGILSKAKGKRIQGLLGESGEGGKKGKGGLSALAKMGITIHLARRMGRAVQSIVQAGSDYLETMNLWQVAMRDNLDMADEFVNKMNKAYGVSTKTVMQAQATFKNMIGSLGDLSSETAYQLSEAITQMALDYSSLYNVKLTQAVDKFQSALAGQVRPIRSISGFDITEKTIHALYQSLGGTKTQRQLSRTEKQLLAILAVYKQMGASGALGDMGKTLNQFANQSRMVVENWIELKSWTGLVLKDLLDQSGVMIHINALLITFTEIVKAIAKSKGLGEENFVDGIFESAEAANDEIDELQGKLLDFDKFRSLEGQGEGEDVALDQVLLDAIASYTSQIDHSKNAAKDLADEWLVALGATRDANGELVFTKDTLDEIVDDFVGLAGLLTSIPTLLVMAKLTGNGVVAGIAAAIAYGYTTNEDFRESLNKLIVALSKVLLPLLDIVVDVLTPILDIVVALITPIAELISFIDDIGLLEPIIYGIAFAFIFFRTSVIDGTAYLDIFGKTINSAFIGIGVLIAGIASLSNAWGDMAGWHQALTIIGAVTAAIIGAVVAFKAFHMAIPAALAMGAMLAGGVMLISSQFKTASNDIPMHANGASDIDGGTLFVAGEMGKTEAVYTGSNGKTNVANVKQMEQAFYNALSRYGAEDGGKIVVEAYLDGEKVYQNTTAKAKARGNIWAKA